MASRLLRGEGAGERTVGTVMGGVEGFHGKDRCREGAGLRHEELLRKGGLLLGEGVEEIFGAVGLDIAVALRGEGQFAKVPPAPAGVAGELVHTEELNGEDTLEFECLEVPSKGDRLLWRDGETWREHVVVRTDEPLDGLCSVYAESSLCELLDDFIEEAQLVSRTALQALTAVLAPTRWAIAYCASLGTAGALIYHQNALWALRRVAEVWGGEVTPVIHVANGRVVYRSIGRDSGQRSMISSTTAAPVFSFNFSATGTRELAGTRT